MSFCGSRRRGEGTDQAVADDFVQVGVGGTLEPQQLSAHRRRRLIFDHLITSTRAEKGKGGGLSFLGYCALSCTTMAFRKCASHVKRKGSFE